MHTLGHVIWAVDFTLEIVVCVMIVCVQVFRWRTAASIVWLLLVTIPVLLVFQVLSSCSLLHPFTWITCWYILTHSLLFLYIKLPPTPNPSTCIEFKPPPFPLKLMLLSNYHAWALQYLFVMSVIPPTNAGCVNDLLNLRTALSSSLSTFSFWL